MMTLIEAARSQIHIHRLSSSDFTYSVTVATNEEVSEEKLMELERLAWKSVERVEAERLRHIEEEQIRPPTTIDTVMHEALVVLDDSEVPLNRSELQDSISSTRDGTFKKRAIVR